MSKHVFHSLLKSALPDVSIAQLNGYWNLAINAQLPGHVFDVIATDLYRIPQVFGAYQQKLGYSPAVMNKELATRLILEMLIEGPRYLSEMQKLFSIPTDLRRKVLTQLIHDRIVRFAFCPIGNCMSYFLSPRIRISKKSKQRIEEVMKCYHTMTLYQLSLYVGECSYSDICAYARTVFQDEEHALEIYFNAGKIHISEKGAFNA